MKQKNGCAVDAQEISVVIPVYNRAALVVRALDSIASQDWPLIRLIVVDNGSTDGSVDAVEKWAAEHCSPESGRSLTLLSESIRGAGAARRKGVEHVQTEFMMCFDSDDVMAPGTLRRAMTVFTSRPDADIVAWPARFHFINGSVRNSKSVRGNIMERHIIHALFGSPLYALRTSLALEAGNWNASLRGWEDWEFGVRLMLRNPCVVGLKECGLDVYCREDSVTGVDFSSRAGVWEAALDAAMRSIRASNVKKKSRFLRLVNYRCVILAAHYAREGNDNIARKRLADVLAQYKGWRRLLLKAIYIYTAVGGRGAYSLTKPLL